jgi:phosphoesterase RecJ-like protein
VTSWRDALSEAVTAIEAADSVIAMGHVGPDGDALGAMLAITLGARAAGKTAVATFGEPFSLADRYRYLDTSTLLHPDEVDGVFDVAVMCDCGTLDRVGSAGPHAVGARQLIVVDHHLSNDGDLGDIRVIDSSAAATTQLVYYLIEDLGWTMTTEIADALYTGLVTDTGRFQYSNTTPEVHRVAAELLALGVRSDVISQHVYEEAPFGYLGVAGAVMTRAQLDEEAEFVWSHLEPADLEQAGIAYEDAEGLIDLIRVTDKAQVACLLRLVDEGVLKGSLRSRGRIDVSAIAVALGGGGHHNAAGFTTRLSPEQTVEFIKGRL